MDIKYNTTTQLHVNIINKSTAEKPLHVKIYTEVA